MSEFNYISEFETAIKSNNKEQQVLILKKAFEEKGFKSEVMHELAGAIASYNLPYISLLEAFCDANPNVPHIAEIRLADYYAGIQRMDEATARARQFLSKLRGSELEKNPYSNPFFHSLMLRAYLLMTAAYTQLGARTYSHRLIEKALALNPTEAFDSKLKNEIQNLDTELQDESAATIDQKWENFFASGENFDELHELCLNNGFPQMARRLDLIHGNFKFKPGFKVDDAEMLMDVFILQPKEPGANAVYELY